MIIRLTIPGEAVPQLRPRFARRGNYTQTYDPPKSKDYKAYVRALAASVKPDRLIEGAVSVRIRVYRQTPAGWSRKKSMAAWSGEIRPTTKPDIDNLAKGIKDALTGIVWRDDAQVVSLTAEKWYSNQPGAIVEIETVGDREEVSA
jgi:Holliday junction resolvase RusA-like endonuclease